MRIVVLCESGRGQSTLAALVGKALGEAGIPFETADSPGSSADDLLADPARLARNAAAVAGRERAAGGRVVVEVKPTPAVTANGRTQRRLPLGNGQVLLVEEGKDALHLATEAGGCPGEVDYYIAMIDKSGVTTYCNAGDANVSLVSGLKEADRVE